MSADYFAIGDQRAIFQILYDFPTQEDPFEQGKSSVEEVINKICGARPVQVEFDATLALSLDAEERTKTRNDALLMRIIQEQEDAALAYNLALAQILHHPPSGAGATQRKHRLKCNPCSKFWKWDFIKPHPGVIAAWPLLYPLGMIGYLIAVPIRLILVACELLQFIYSFVRCVGKQNFWQNMKIRLIMVAVSIGELLSGLIGCAIPPIAYKMDEFLEKSQIVQDDRWLGWWRYSSVQPAGGAYVPPHADGGAGPAIFPGESDAIERSLDSLKTDGLEKKEEIAAPFITYFKEAVLFLHAETGMSEAVEALQTLQYNITLGLSFALLDGSDIEALFSDIELDQGREVHIGIFKENLKNLHVSPMQIKKWLVETAAYRHLESKEKHEIPEEAINMFCAALPMGNKLFFGDRKMGQVLGLGAYRPFVDPKTEEWVGDVANGEGKE